MTILPLAVEPFTPSTERDMRPSERREFVRTHRTCVFGTPRRADGPAMSIVYYVPTDSDRVVLRCRPYSTFAQPPRHLHSNDQEDRITHWVSASMPWDAPDPN